MNKQKDEAADSRSVQEIAAEAKDASIVELAKASEGIADQRGTSDKGMAATAADDLRMLEIERGYRVLDTPKWGRVRVYKDTLPSIKEAGDMQFHRTRFALLKDPSVPTYDELYVVLVARGVWSPETDARITELFSIVDSRNADRDQQKDLLAWDEETNKLIDELWTLIGRKEYWFGGSVETMSEVARRRATMAMAIRRDVDGVAEFSKLSQVFTEDDLRALPEADFLYVRQLCNQFWAADNDESFFGESPEEATSSSVGE